MGYKKEIAMKVNYDEVIELLDLELVKIVEQLKVKRSKALIAKKKQIDNAIKWLKKGMEHQISPDAKSIVLPEKRTQTPSSEYRLIEDHETDDKQYWTEVKINDSELRPLPGDLLLMT